MLNKKSKDIQKSLKEHKKLYYLIKERERESDYISEDEMLKRLGISKDDLLDKATSKKGLIL